MKSSLILLSLLSVSLCFELTAKTEIFKDFQKFIQKYGKKYKTPSEFMKRFDIFVNNYHSIETINHSNLLMDVSQIIKLESQNSLTSLLKNSKHNI